jgi:hypothetical protein
VDFLQRMLDGIGHFRQVKLAYDIKCILRHCQLLSYRFSRSCGRCTLPS